MSFLKAIDEGLRASLFLKFEDILDLADVNTGVLLYPKEVAFRMVSEKKGKAISEFINLWRIKTGPSWARQNTGAARRGMRVAYTDDTNTSTEVVKAMAVDLEYNVWFWSKDLDKLNDIAERYLFWQQDDPNLNLYYNDVYPAELNLHFGELIDESNVPSMLDRGNHFILRVPIKVDGWIFTSADAGTVIHKIELVLYDSQNLTDYRECIYETNEYDSTVEATLKLNEEHIFGILDVDADTQTFSVSKTDTGNASEFVAGEYLYVTDSTGNDGKYLIVSSADETTYTTIVVSEIIPNTTVDGNIILKNIE